MIICMPQLSSVEWKTDVVSKGGFSPTASQDKALLLSMYTMIHFRP